MEELNNRVFVVDKAAGPTSFAVVAAFKRAARLRKVGHTGTLDPLAEGVLLLCTGTATRAAEHFMNLEKVYQFDVCLGVETDTLDREGKVVREAPCPELGEDEIRAVAKSFAGKYELTPPAYSALKKNGRRLYEMARAGETPEIQSRTVDIYDFEVVSIALPRVTCRIRCSRGTYVRSLAKDFGERLNLPAHIDRIARTRVGSFDRAQGFRSDRLFDGDVSGLTGLDLSDALDFLPGVVLDDKAQRALRYGTLPGIKDVVQSYGDVKTGGPVRILDGSGGLIAIGERSRGKRRNPLQLVDSFRLYTESKPNGGLRRAR
jgi:tRNA pseudouridine55 synthase